MPSLVSLDTRDPRITDRDSDAATQLLLMPG